MTAKEVLKKLYQAGWYEIDQDGSHKHLKHPTIPGKLTVPAHSGKDIAPGTLNQILKQAGLK